MVRLSMANTLRRLSLALRLSKNTKSSPMEAGSALAEFLVANKHNYLNAIKEDPSRGSEWTVVMGNEANDLDTMASSIAYAWVESEVHKRPTIPLMPIEKDDLDLRAENLYVLKLVGISKPKDQLLFLSDIPHLRDPNASFPSHRFALVDHNKIKDRYILNNPDFRIIAVIDHHEDEGLYKDTANPRVVSPSGSCCSHITASALPTPDQLPPNVSVPRELATLLLCGILLDTDGLRPNGKALQLDRDAAAALTPLSIFSSSITSTLFTVLTGNGKLSPNALYEEKSLRQLTKTLSAKKNDLSHLGIRDLLRRDYKEYDYLVEWLPGRPTIRVGLSTVPLPLKQWAAPGQVEREIVNWMKTRGLEVFGAITTFKKQSKKKVGEETGSTSGKKGKSKREQLWMILTDDQLNKPGSKSSRAKVDVDQLAQKLWDRLEADKNLQLSKHKQLNLNMVPKEARLRAYIQGDPSLTRKYTAPLLKAILTETTSVTTTSDGRTDNPASQTQNGISSS